MIRTNTFLIISLLFLSSMAPIYAQEEKPLILTEPQEWSYEKINFPLDFAPEIAYQGFEELRFAPGMFDRSSSHYFTYLFALSIADKSKFKRKEIEAFLLMYYKGLCAAVAKSKEQSIDTSKITVSLKKNRASKQRGKQYSAQVVFFDTFNEGQKVLLQMELAISSNKKTKKSQWLALVSPDEKGSAIWKELYQLRDKVKPLQ